MHDSSNLETLEIVLVTEDGQEISLEEMLLDEGVEATMEKLGIHPSEQNRRLLESYLAFSRRISQHSLRMLNVEKQLEEALAHISYSDLLDELNDLDESERQEILDLYAQIHAEDDEDRLEDEHVFPILQ